MLVHLASLSVLLLGATAGPLISRDDAPHEFPYREDLSAAVSKRQSSSYWYEEIDHQGISAFGPSGYVVYRNVMDYGATGNGVTDDTAAINAAISDGGRCGEGCASSTTTPAVVYFPAGTYLISSSIIDYYYTQLIGNPNDMPVIMASEDFSGFGLIDGDPYYTANLNWGSTNVFYRQVRNFIMDMTSVPASSSVIGIHWPTAQATSLQNIVFQMSEASGTQHVGVFCESGSAGFVSDLVFNGGLYGAELGNQQFTMRNLTFNNCVTAISMFWDWGWVFQDLSINSCQTGLNMSTGGSSDQSVGSITLVDSSISDTPVGIISAYDSSSQPETAGSLILENIELRNVPTAVQLLGSGDAVLAGSSESMTITAWGQGNEYTSSGEQRFQGSFTPNSRPASLLSGNKYYARSKPQYETLPASSFLSVRSQGATGNGVTDDTTALQNAINQATAAGQVVYFDGGTYLVTSTLSVPPGAILVGESYPVIMSSGSFFSDMSNPQPVVQVGTAGQTGQVEWSDMIVSTQGAQGGAILIEWNLASDGTPSGMWDVHARVGGFEGSDLGVSECEKTPDSTTINNNCIAAYMTMHVTSSASNLYMENNWLWTADHDIDNQDNTQITVYNGRGLLIESTTGTLWLVGTAVEHHTLYQYQFANTQNVYIGFMQTETPYYQPNPQAPAPFTSVSSLNDPDFSACSGQGSNCYDAWAMRVVDSSNILIYGAGFYSFFNNYNGSCNAEDGPEDCQVNIVDLKGTSETINSYCLTTVGTTNMMTENGNSIATYEENVNVFGDTIALVRISSTSAGSGSSTSSNSDWSFLGCYTDNVSGRALPMGIPAPGGSNNMTVENCEAGCLSRGYTLAGVEYANQCYCGDTLENGSGPASDGNALCDMACTGDSSETCGGPNRLDLYSYVGTAVPTSTSAAVAKKRSISSRTAAATDGSWNFLGCYTDDVSGRALPEGIPAPGGSNNMTVENCQNGCLQLGYSLAGVEYANQCYCGNTLENGSGPAPDGNALCDMACTGDSSQTCGGPNRLDLYQYVPGTAKRGLAYNNNNPDGNATYANLFEGYSKISWGYDWGYPSWNLSSSFEFVPMLWGLPSGSDPSWTAAVEEPGTKNILGFNEPDLTYSGSSNILPAAAASGYQTYMEPFVGTVKVGMPNVLWNNYGSSSGGDYDSAVWTQYFLGNCTGCQFSFAAIHWYQDCEPADGQSGAVWFEGNVTNAYETLNLPVWITEFQCYGTDAQQVAFLQEVLPWLDSQDYVEKYAYFGVFPEYLVDSAGTGLSDIGLAYATT